MNETTKKYLGWLIVVIAILVAGYLGVQYPIPAPPTSPLAPPDVESRALATGGIKCHSVGPTGDCIEIWNGGDVKVYSNQGTTSKFSVDGATGDTTIAGNLAVSGVPTFSGGALTLTKTFLGTFPMTVADTRPFQVTSSPTTTTYLNKTLAYFRADLDANRNDSVAGEDGFTVGMFRGYVGAATMQGFIGEGLRAGFNLDAGATVNDPAGAGYIAGARITTYVPATANAKTNKGLIVAPRDDTAVAAIAGSQYIGEQIYLQQATAKSESWGLDIYTEPACATMTAGINIRNGSTEKYGYGVDMNDMSEPVNADIRLSNGNVIVASDGGVVYNRTVKLTVSQINTVYTIVNVPATRSFRLIDAKATGYGGTCTIATSVYLKSGSNTLVTWTVANLVQSTLLELTTTGAAVAADGASFNVQTAGADVTIEPNSASLAGCTGVQVNLTYALD